MNGLNYRFLTHRGSAKARGIIFRLTYTQWLRIWEVSGHLHERGCRKGQWVMARFGDKGAYAVGNVEIIRQEQNHREARPRQKYTNAGRADMSVRTRGERNGNAKLTENIVHGIKKAYPNISRFERMGISKLLAKKYGVCPQMISNILSGKSWRHVY